MCIKKYFPTRGMSPTEITNYFINKSKNKFEDRFDYSAVGEVSSGEDFCTIVCKVHGSAKTNFSKHLSSGTGCKKCGKIACEERRTLSYEGFMKELDNLYPKRRYKIISRTLVGGAKKGEVYVQDDFGICKISVTSLLKGANPSIKTAVCRQTYARNRFRQVLGYSGLCFNKTFYSGALSYITVTCHKHGEFKTKPNWILALKKGCPACGNSRRGAFKRSNTERFISEAIKRFGKDRSIYDRVKYVGAKVPVEIFCENHNSYFKTKPNDYLNGSGCIDCARDSWGYKRTNFINASRDGNALLYLIKIYSDIECFYKVGITSGSVRARFLGDNLKGYKYSIVYQSSFEASLVWDTEHKGLKDFKKFSYTPNVKFAGYTECLSIDLPVEDVISYIEMLN